MYEENKSNYRRVFEKSFLETKELAKNFPEITIYQIIYNQLLDLRCKIVINREVITREELFEKYSFGSIVAKNFDETEYGNDLMFVYGMSYKYENLPDI